MCVKWGKIKETESWEADEMVHSYIMSKKQTPVTFYISPTNLVQ